MEGNFRDKSGNNIYVSDIMLKLFYRERIFKMEENFLQ